MEQTAIETCRSWFDSRAGELQTRGIELECQRGKWQAVFWLYAPNLSLMFQFGITLLHGCAGH